MLYFLDNWIRRFIVLGLAIVFPVVELLFGLPIIYAAEPLPAFTVITPEMIALLTAVSIIASLASVVSGFAFWLEKRTNRKIDSRYDETITKICVVEGKVDDLRKNVDKVIHEKYNHQKEVSDQRFQAVAQMQELHNRRLDNLEDRYYNQGVKGSHGNR